MTDVGLESGCGTSSHGHGSAGLIPRAPSRPEPGTAKYEEVVHDADCAIAIRSVVDRRFEYPWHYHPEFELTLIVSGHGRRHVGDSIEAFAPGDLVLIGGSTPHCWSSAAGRRETDSAIVIQFEKDAFGAGFLELLETRPLALLLQRAERGLAFGGASRDHAATLMQHLARRGITRLEKLSGLISILTILATGGEGRLLALGGAQQGFRESSRAEEVLRYIREHASERLSRAELARLAGMSSGTFSRFFARQFGKPFVTYVAEVRVGNACRMLREENLGVSDIAHEVGFHNLANFNRTFLRLKGMTPSAYRRMARAPG